jgi:hypothetical protein
MNFNDEENVGKNIKIMKNDREGKFVNEKKKNEIVY